MARKKKQAGSALVIRREEVVEGGHHGGAWKVAYADFVTAMMAFFLLMWLINATTEKQRRGIADYFSPNGAKTRSQSGSGKPFGGLTPFEQGSQVSNLGAVSLTDSVSNPENAVAADDDADPAGGSPGGARDAVRQAGRALVAPAASDPDAVPVEGNNHKDGNSGRGTAVSDNGEAGDAPPHPAAAVVAVVPGPPASPRADAAPIAPKPDPAATGSDVAPAREDQQLRQAARAVATAVASDPVTSAVASQVSVAVTPEGLRIQIEDSERAPMFDPGSALPNPRARALLERIGPVLAPLAEPLTITGHTDDAPCRGACVSNWALSTARADATRMVLDANGMPDDRVVRVAGVADRDALNGLPANAPANRRIVLVLQRLEPPPSPVKRPIATAAHDSAPASARMPAIGTAITARSGRAVVLAPWKVAAASARLNDARPPVLTETPP